MYVPEPFVVDDPATALACAAAHPFATVVTQGEDGLAVSHLPLLVDELRGIVRGHLARANAQLAHFAAGVDVLAIFHGPHGYVSPSVYAADESSVPTWNYVVVHVRGKARLVDEPGLRRILSDSVARFDTTGWRSPSDEGLLKAKLDAIAGFEIEIAHLQGKWKLSQNRTLDDQRRVAAWLARGDGPSRALAEMMRGRI